MTWPAASTGTGPDTDEGGAATRLSVTSWLSRYTRSPDSRFGASGSTAASTRMPPIWPRTPKPVSPVMTSSSRSGAAARVRGGDDRGGRHQIEELLLSTARARE